MGLLSKINRTVCNIKKSYKSDKEFSKEFARNNLYCSIAGLLKQNKVVAKRNKIKNEFVVDYLTNIYFDVIEKFKNDDFQGDNISDAPIWVCWWTGEETAPDIVKQCIKSIRKNAGNHTVNIITKQNYSQYLDIPEYILEKVNDGRMCVANFSDYLRFSLLAKYGGLWIDATIFCSREISPEFFEKPVFTCKYYSENSSCISASRWTTFCIGGWKGNVFFRFMQEAFECYWQKEDYAIDYLLVDYTIYMAYCYVSTFKDSIDSLKNNNVHRNELAKAMVEGKPAEYFDLVINPETVFYKLSWREKYPLLTNNGEKSVYAYFLEKKI